MAWWTKRPGGNWPVGKSHLVIRFVVPAVCFAAAVVAIVLVIENRLSFVPFFRGTGSFPRVIDYLWVGEYDITWLWALAVLSALGFVIYVSLRHLVLTHSEDPFDAVAATAPSTAELDKRVRALAPLVAEAEYFLALVTEPRAWITRITESADQLTRSTALRTTLTVRTPKMPGSVSTLLIPVHFSLRGSLETGFHVLDADSKRISTVSHIDTIAFSIAIFERFVARAGAATVATYAATLQNEVRELLSSSAWQRASGAALDHLSDRALRVPGELTQLKPGNSSLAKAARLFNALSRDYPVCVRVAVPSSAAASHRLTVERRAINPVFERVSWSLIRKRVFGKFNLTSGGVTRILQIVFTVFSRLFSLLAMVMKLTIQEARLLAGVSLVAAAIPLENAVRGASYHLEVHGPEQTYVASQGMEDADGIPIPSSHIALGPLRGNTLRPQGQRIANLHLSAGQEAVASWKFVVRFFERTPGSMAIALVTAFAAFVPTGLIALQEMEDRLVLGGPEDGFDPSGLLQILLAAPFVIAAMSNVAGRRSLWGSFGAARLSMFVTIVASFAALVLSNVPDRLNVVPGAIWLGIVLTLFLNVFIALISWVMRVAVQSSFYNRQQGS